MEITVKAMPILPSADLPAKAQFLEMMHHNGRFGCKDCLVEGRHVTSGNGTANYYSYELAVNARKRTHTDFKSDAKAAFHSGKTVRYN